MNTGPLFKVEDRVLRRGYALLVEVERNGEKRFERVQSFNEDTCEYYIADFDPLIAQQTDAETGHVDEIETQARQETPVEAAPKRKRGRPPGRALPAESSKVFAVARSAGG